MYDCTRHYINGQWTESTGKTTLDIINPATEASIGKVALGSVEDTNRAVAAAKAAFPGYARWTVQQRKELLQNIYDEYKKRWNDVAAAISAEMGAPIGFATRSQAGSGIGHLKGTLAALDKLELEEQMGTTRVLREPVGVCGLITPWNWPINQIMCKVAPALAAGCTVVLKPSEVAPASAHIFAEILDAAGVPAGVFNLVQGDGPGVGSTLSAHTDIDMMSFTGSTRAGALVARAAADTIKRVSQELGGKSANIILENAPLRQAVEDGVHHMMHNSGQSCNAPSRMLVPESVYEEAVAIAVEAANATVVGDPQAEGTDIGPVVSETQYDRIQNLIERGIAEGARIAAGGPGKPEGLETGYYVKPTVFRDVNNDMIIAREEIFGPVLTMIPYRTVEEAINIANDSEYGLSGYVYGGSTDDAMEVARQLRTGMVHLNGAPTDVHAPFGGYKKSGNGREWGLHGLEDYFEIKAVMGAA